MSANAWLQHLRAITAGSARKNRPDIGRLRLCSAERWREKLQGERADTLLTTVAHIFTGVA